MNRNGPALKHRRWTDLITSLVRLLRTDPDFEAEIRRKISARQRYLAQGPYDNRDLNNAFAPTY